MLDCMEIESSTKKKKWRHGISKDAVKRIEIANVMTITFLNETFKVRNQYVMV